MYWHRVLHWTYEQSINIELHTFRLPSDETQENETHKDPVPRKHIQNTQALGNKNAWKQDARTTSQYDLEVGDGHISRVAPSDIERLQELDIASIFRAVIPAVKHGGALFPARSIHVPVRVRLSYLQHVRCKIHGKLDHSWRFAYTNSWSIILWRIAHNTHYQSPAVHDEYRKKHRISIN